MKLRGIGLTGSVLSLTACAGAMPSAPTAAPPPATTIRVAETGVAVEAFTDPQRRAKLLSALPALDAFVEAQRAAHALPSLVVGVVIDGELVFHKGVGPRSLDGKDTVDADTVYRIGSITKTFTGLSLLKLRDEGKVALDDPATRWLPELAAVRYPTRDSAPITLRHVLTHASGLPTLGGFVYAQADHDVTEAEMLRGLTGVALLAPPGTRDSYSNLGFGLLGVVIRRASGVRYRDYVSREILSPLGMSQTRWDRHDVPAGRLATAYQHTPQGPREVPHWRLGEFEAAGGLYSSVRDLARYVAFQLEAYPARNDGEHGPVRRSTVRESHVLQRPGDLHVTRNDPAPAAEPIDANASGVGIAWQGRQTCQFEQIVGHAGGTEGYTSFIRLLPQRGFGIIALTNLQDAELYPIVRGATELLVQTGGLIPRSIPPSPAVARAAARGIRIYNAFDEPEYADLFAPVFRAAFSAARMTELINEFKKLHGLCQPDALVPMTVESPDAAVFAVPCERGWFAYRVAITPDGRIVESTGKSHEGPVTPDIDSRRCP